MFLRTAFPTDMAACKMPGAFEPRLAIRCDPQGDGLMTPFTDDDSAWSDQNGNSGTAFHTVPAGTATNQLSFDFPRQSPPSAASRLYSSANAISQTNLTPLSRAEAALENNRELLELMPYFISARAVLSEKYGIPVVEISFRKMGEYAYPAQLDGVLVEFKVP